LKASKLQLTLVLLVKLLLIMLIFVLHLAKA